MRKDRLGFNNGGKESKDFSTLLRRGRKSRKLIDELLGSPLFKRRLKALCRLLTGNEWDAEDLYNEVCLKLCTVLPKFKPKYKRPYGNFFNWLGTVTRNTFFDSRRGLRFQFTIVSIDNWDADSEFDLEDRYELNDRKRRLREGIARLPEKKQIAMRLYIREGYSSRETANILAARGIKITHATVALWVRQLIRSVFPEAKDAVTEPPRKPNARARQTPGSASKLKTDAETEKSPAKVGVRKTSAKA